MVGTATYLRRPGRQAGPSVFALTRYAATYSRRVQRPRPTCPCPDDYGNVSKIASKLIPRQAAETLQAKGIDIREIIRLSNNPDARGTLVEVEEHDKNEKIVISLE